MISDVILGKPNKATSMVFLIFGYVLASYIVSPIDLVFEQKIPAVIIAGGVFSAFLFYIKPVDRLMKTFLAVRNYYRKKTLNSKKIELIDSENPMAIEQHLFHNDVITTKLLDSPLVAEEMAKINGAVFFSASLLLASRLLDLIDLYVPFELLVLLAVVMLVVAVWEGLSLVGFKLPILNFYYRVNRIGEPSIELSKAINNKEWLLARNLMMFLLDNKLALRSKLSDLLLADLSFIGGVIFSPYTSEGGICPKCSLIVRRKEPDFCPKCGSRLITSCPNCMAGILIEKMDVTPIYCTSCGKALIPSQKTDRKTNPTKKP